MPEKMSRGLLIVLEGCDRAGKSTQSKRLVNYLQNLGRKAALFNFPDRTTRIGKMIGQYLENNAELEDHAVHLLFSANRWELVPKMKKLLNEGCTLVLDRYAYSGVAFSASKNVNGMNLDWCKQSDVGLPRPDLVLYLDLPVEESSKRGDFGNERYEKVEFQKAVYANYEKLRSGDWKVVDARPSTDEVTDAISAIVKEHIEQGVVHEEIQTLWT